MKVQNDGSGLIPKDGTKTVQKTTGFIQKLFNKLSLSSNGNWKIVEISGIFVAAHVSEIFVAAHACYMISSAIFRNYHSEYFKPIMIGTGMGIACTVLVECIAILGGRFLGNTLYNIFSSPTNNNPQS